MSHIKDVVKLLFLFGFMACSNTPTQPLSTVPVQQKLTTAQGQATTIQQSARSAQTTNDQIRAKDELIDQWHQQHPGQ